MILQYLDLSTGHVTQATMQWLEAESSEESRTHPTLSPWPAMTIANYEYGVFVTVPPLDEADIAEQMQHLPQDLANVLWGAHHVGATLVRFDSDGPVDPTLPHHEW